MRIPSFSEIDHNRRSQEMVKDPMYLWVIKRIDGVWRAIRNITTALNGGLGFGDGTSIDNIAGKWVEYTTNAIANTEDAVTHDLGVIPAGFIVMVPPVSGVVNKGTTAWTTTTIYLKCSAADQTATLFLLIPPRTGA